MAPRSRPALPGRARGEAGQATVELVLALPVVLLALLLVLQVGLVVAAHVQVVHAARDGARAAAIHGTAAAAEEAVHEQAGLQPARTEVGVEIDRSTGGLVRVEVRHRVPTDVPLVGPLVGDPTVAARSVMALEAVAPPG